MASLVSPPLGDPFGARATLSTPQGTTVSYYRLAALAEQGIAPDLDSLPFTVRILLENVLRNAGGEFVEANIVEALAQWRPRPRSEEREDIEVPFLPGRVLLQPETHRKTGRVQHPAPVLVLPPRRPDEQGHTAIKAPTGTGPRPRRPALDRAAPLGRRLGELRPLRPPSPRSGLRAMPPGGRRGPEDVRHDTPHRLPVL